MWQSLMADFLRELLPLLQLAPVTTSAALSYFIITNYYFLLITYHLSLTTYYLLLITYYLSLITYHFLKWRSNVGRGS